MAQRPEQVVVIGGGILGTSTAAHLAERGCSVALLTDGPLASGASGRSLAWLNSAGERSAAYHALRLVGIDRWRTWRARHPESAEYLHFDGGLTWAAPAESYRERYRYERAHGYDSRWLEPSDIAAYTPGVNPDAVNSEGAIFNAGEGWVDLPSAIAALARLVTERGSRVVENAGRVSPVIENGHAVAAVTSDGERYEADAVVLATGPSVPGQLAELGFAMGDDTPAALVVFTTPVSSELVSVLNTPRAAVRRTVNGGLAIDSAWSEESLSVADDGTINAPREVVDGLLAEASAVLSGHPDLEVSHLGIGYKPIPGGGEPVLGGTAQVPGLFVAFSHSGATLGLAAGELLAEEIVTGTPSPLVSTFSPDRYAQASA